MKIIKQKNKNYKLIKLNLIKSKIIDKKLNEKKVSIEDVTSRLKRALQLIYLYHIHNKKIIFIGNPLNINKEFILKLKNKKHNFIPESFWISGMLTNRYSTLKPDYESNENKTGKRWLKLKSKSDLIVIVDKISNAEALKESYLCGLPAISLNDNLNPFETEPSLKVPGDFTLLKNRIKKNFFYSILLSTLKKASSVKKKHWSPKKFSLSTLKAIKKRKAYNKWGVGKKRNSHLNNKLGKIV